MFHRVLSYPSLFLGPMTWRWFAGSNLPDWIRNRADLRGRSQDIAVCWLLMEQERVDFDALKVNVGDSVSLLC